ncbi:glutaredoxin-like protein NrdH [Rhodococcus zopfii]|uniref:glutaredoxin-like protein NrdH n=1 Tax=Rhodococcus zopfii TaxID=43772 RepID=UPI00093351B9
MTTPIITIYSKPDCQQCTATARALDKGDVPYAYIDVTQRPDALTFIQELGYKAVPVVVAGDMHWGGFRPDRVKALIRAYHDSEAREASGENDTEPAAVTALLQDGAQ